MAEQYKFNRSYLLTFSFNDSRNDINIEPPLNIEFECTKYDTGSTSSAIIKVYNLNVKNRLHIEKNDTDTSKIIKISLKVGYKNSDSLNLKNLFIQSVLRSYTYRDGADYITIIECNNSTNILDKPLPPTGIKNLNQLINYCADGMKEFGITKGAVNQRINNTRPLVAFGNAYDLLFDQIQKNETFFIDDEQFYILKNNQVVSRFIPIVSADTGLLDTPIMQDSLINFSMLISPEVKLARRFEIISTVNSKVNNVYKCIQIQYSGNYMGDNWIQTVTGTLSNNYEVISK